MAETVLTLTTVSHVNAKTLVYRFYRTMNVRTPRIYLGTMTFAWSQTSSKVDEAVARDMLKFFSELSNRIDTARIYAGGKTEECLGKACDASADGLSFWKIGTKAHPSQPGGLSQQGICSQYDKSYELLPTVFAEYYLHQPDPETPLQESLACLHEMSEKGLIQAIGMSNYHASEMERAFQIAPTAPSVYQGLYNPLNRLVEEELLPMLRKNNCSFVAYNPLAAGLLSGKYDNPDGSAVPKGRFKNNQNYLPRFYTEANFEALDVLRRACNGASITLVDATFRWLLCHSALTEHDGILIGASSMAQLEENLGACRDAKPLPQEVLDAFDEAWSITKKAGVFPYWRSYSADMPNRDSLHPGASYQATKK